MQTISAAALQKAITRAAQPIAIIGAVGGFIGDIIQPLGDFALWIAGLSLAIAIGSLVWIIQLRRRAGEEVWDTIAAGIFVVAVGSFVVFAIWTIIFAAGPERGYLATNVPAIGDLQAQLLGLQKDVTQIKKTTGETATRVAESSDLQKAQATAQAQGFAEIQKTFAALQAGQGTLIANPQTPQEWYSNARLYQLKGDAANAIKAYEGYFQFNLDFVDPYLDYSALLKATEGIARTRQRIDDLYNANKVSPTLDLIATTLMDSPDDRLARLRALTLRETLYAPAWLELGIETNRAFQKTPTNDLAQKQQIAFETAFKLENDQQGYTRYFIDKARADKNLADARQILTGAQQYGKIVGTIKFEIFPSYDGVLITLNSPDVATAQKLLFNIDDPQPKREAGKIVSGSTTYINPVLGTFKLPPGAHTVYVQYIDVNGATSQVYSQTFRVDPIAVVFMQKPPDFSTGLVPVTFTISIVDANPNQFYKYKYSVDSNALDQQAEKSPFVLTLDLNLKQGEHVLHIQATGDDGKSTPVVQFAFTVK